MHLNGLSILVSPLNLDNVNYDVETTRYALVFLSDNLSAPGLILAVPRFALRCIRDLLSPTLTLHLRRVVYGGCQVHDPRAELHGAAVAAEGSKIGVGDAGRAIA
jgi:hypothetical protein